MALRAHARASFRAPPISIEAPVVLFAIASRRLALQRALAVTCAALALACAGRGDARRDSTPPASGGSESTIGVDDFGDTVALTPAKRIVSLSPMTTELLFTIGAGPLLVGRTEYDVWPAAAKSVPSVGPGIRPNVERILAARPDLVVLYAANDNRGAARALRAAGVRTVALKSDHLGDFARAARFLGAVSGRDSAAQQALDSVHATLDRVARSVRGLPKPRVLWFLWDNPPMVLGSGSYQSELLAVAGGENVYRERREPAAQVSMEDILTRDPQIVFADPGADIQLKTSARWGGIAARRGWRIVTIDDTLLNRPGVTLGMAAVSLARALHPGWRGP
ncbi:MAG TPA: helical backbone metal receptor [Gemmatimonadaceae bacterium]